ncbi:claudin-34 [Polymixia lowei]
MLYLADTAHWQFLGLVVGCVAWVLTIATAGLDEWRLWYVDDVSVVTSGVAWVGIWRACFYSHALPDAEFCHAINIADGFVPVEISVAQVLTMVAVCCGLAGNISAVFAVRTAYFSVDRRDHIKLVFSVAGALYTLTGTCTLVPLFWNMSSVMNNSTIDFPPEFLLPAAPKRQKVGLAIAVGVFASVVMIICGLIFLCYRYTKQDMRSGAEPVRDARDPLHGTWTVTTLSQNSGKDNPAFHTEDE